MQQCCDVHAISRFLPLPIREVWRLFDAPQHWVSQGRLSHQTFLNASALRVSGSVIAPDFPQRLSTACLRVGYRTRLSSTPQHCVSQGRLLHQTFLNNVEEA